MKNKKIKIKKTKEEKIDAIIKGIMLACLMISLVILFLEFIYNNFTDRKRVV